MSIEFAGASNVWYLPKATACHRRANPNPRTPSAGNSICPSSIFEVSHVENLNLAFEPEAQTKITADLAGNLKIEFLEKPPANFKSRSMVVLNKQQWQQNGALAFTGKASMGEDIAPGARHYTTSGNWEAHQLSLISQYVRPVTDVVKAGDLVRGAEVQVFIGDEPAIMSGHMTPAWSSDEPGFVSVMMSEPGHTELRLQHFGFSEPATISPDWIDAALNNSLFVALIALMSFAITVLQLISSTTDLMSNPALNESDISEQNSTGMDDARATSGQENPTKSTIDPAVATTHSAAAKNPLAEMNAARAKPMAADASSPNPTTPKPKNIDPNHNNS